MNILTQDELKKIVEGKLRAMGGEEILFPDSKENLVMVLFNSKELTSFKAELPGWVYSGTHLDPTRVRQYKIDFVKNPASVGIDRMDSKTDQK